MLLGWGVRLQLQVGQHRAQEQPGAMLSRDQIGVLALPAEAGRLGQGLFHQGRGVDEHLDLAAEPGGHPAAELLQPALDQLVIVVALGIDGDRRPIPLRQDLQRIAVGAIAEAEHHGRARVRPHPLRVAAAPQRLLHPVHGPVAAGPDELGQARARRPRRLHRGEARGVEAEGLRPLADQGLGIVRSRDRHSGRPGPGPAAGRRGAAGTTAGTLSYCTRSSRRGSRARARPRNSR